METSTGSRPRGVARIWRGRTTADMADAYGDYLYEEGVRRLEQLGARGVQMLREDRGAEAEFLVISYWDTLEAMTCWAGADPRRIRHLERDAEMLVELPDGVQILDVLSNNWALADAMRRS